LESVLLLIEHNKDTLKISSKGKVYVWFGLFYQKSM